MTIQTLYRVQCQPCERYLPDPSTEPTSLDATPSTAYAAHFLTFSSAYNEAVRRGWSAYPLVCPDCAADRLTREE